MTHLSEAILNGTQGMVFTLQDPIALHQVKDKIDFIVLDTTQRDWPVATIAQFIDAAGEKPVFIRTADLSTTTLQAYLNCDVDGLILCGVHHAAEAEKAIAACLYPPEGVRPFVGHPLRQKAANDISLQAVNDQLTLIIEIAHPQAVAQIEDIAEVTGVNGVLLSPRKLSVAMERGFDGLHDDVQFAMRSVIQTAQGFELPWGVDGDWVAGKNNPAPSFHFVCSDLELLQQGLTGYFPEDEESEETESVFGLRAMR